MSLIVDLDDKCKNFCLQRLWFILKRIIIVLFNFYLFFLEDFYILFNFFVKIGYSICFYKVKFICKGYLDFEQNIFVNNLINCVIVYWKYYLLFFGLVVLWNFRVEFWCYLI